MISTESVKRAGSWLEQAGAWQAFLIVFVPILGVYLITMSDSEIWTNVDTVAAALPAWRFALFGDLDLSQFEGIRFLGEINGHFMSNRTPGISFISVPAYWLFGQPSFTGVIPISYPQRQRRRC